MTAPSPQKVRRTQEERSAAMRARLLDATIDSLIDLGYSATTTTVIAERAGASRGAQLHHFSTKAELVAAAVEHLANKMGGELQRLASKPGGGRIDAGELIDALWASFRSPLFVAWLELSVAARTDADLRAALSPVEGRLRGALTTWTADGFARDVIGDDVEIWLTFYVLQGLALDRTVGSESSRLRNEREKRALDTWKRLVTDRLR